MFSESQRGRKLSHGQRAIQQLMNWGTDHPGITSISSKINLKPYLLTIDDEVKNPVILIWMDLLALSKTLFVSDFHYVEGWSVLNC